MRNNGKHSEDSSRPYVATDHTHSESNKGQYLMIIAIVGVLLIALQLFSIINSRGAERDRELNLINQKFAQQAVQNRANTCAFISTIPPDNGLIDKIRAEAKCGTYIPPSKTKSKSKTPASTGSTSSMKTAASGAVKITVSGGSPPQAAAKTPATAKTSSSNAGAAPAAASPSAVPAVTVPHLLSLKPACVLVVCIR